MTSCDFLRLDLSWYRTRGLVNILCILFGITHRVCVMFIRFSQCVLVKVLAKDPLARITMPSAEEIDILNKSINDF